MNRSGTPGSTISERGGDPENYNQASILLENEDLKVILHCRAYDEGVAFALDFPGRKVSIH
jgi:hypothetical protein